MNLITKRLYLNLNLNLNLNLKPQAPGALAKHLLNLPRKRWEYQQIMIENLCLRRGVFIWIRIISTCAVNHVQPDLSLAFKVSKPIILISVMDVCMGPKASAGLQETAGASNNQGLVVEASLKFIAIEISIACDSSFGNGKIQFIPTG